eukprot:sb/3471475/
MSMPAFPNLATISSNFARRASGPTSYSELIDCLITAASMSQDNSSYHLPRNHVLVTTVLQYIGYHGYHGSTVYWLPWLPRNNELVTTALQYIGYHGYHGTMNCIGYHGSTVYWLPWLPWNIIWVTMVTTEYWSPCNECVHILKQTTNQGSLFRSRDWLSANQGPVWNNQLGLNCEVIYSRTPI